MKAGFARFALALVCGCGQSSSKADAGPSEADPRRTPKAAPDPTEEQRAKPALAEDPKDESIFPGPNEDEDFALMQAEEVEGIRIGMSGTDVVGAVGEPKTKTPVDEEPATGAWVSVWAFPDRGIELQMAAADKNGALSVAAIVLGDTSKAKTSRGIGIGSTVVELEKVYGEDKDTDMSSDDNFIAGSVHGGIGFRVEDDKVEHIFIGAMAE